MMCNAVVTAKCFENAESWERRLGADVARHGGCSFSRRLFCPGHCASEELASDGVSCARNASMAAKNSSAAPSIMVVTKMATPIQ